MDERYAALLEGVNRLRVSAAFDARFHVVLDRSGLLVPVLDQTLHAPALDQTLRVIAASSRTFVDSFVEMRPLWSCKSEPGDRDYSIDVCSLCSVMSCDTQRYS